MTNEEVCDWLYRIRSMAEVFMSEAQNEKAKEAVATAIKALKQQKTGKWKCKGMGCYCTDMQGRETWYRSYQCDSCEHIIRAIEGNIETCKYCPNCGARMEVYGDDK